jgi:O-acetyl-ADP-ribose deacetylase (regulator of RNase III)
MRQIRRTIAVDVTMLPERILLVDRSHSLCEAWSQAFQSFDQVEVVEGDFFASDSDAMISPANSFGIMDGGLDLAIRNALGIGIQAVVQRTIIDRHHGEMPVGCAEVVATSNMRWPHLVVAPTMRIPESVAQTVNAYLSFRAALLAVDRHNTGQGGPPIRSLLVPGLGTGVGGMDPRRCAAQMRIAYDHVSKPARIPSAPLIHEVHRKLRSEW